jgi:K+-sensing histidine kinase KdpD
MTKQHLFSVQSDDSATESGALAGLAGYLLAAVTLAAALALRLALDPLWADRLPYVTFFLAELVIVQFVGVGPFVFTLVSGFVLADWLFVPPRHSLLVADRVNQVNGAFFFLISFTLLFFSWRARRARERERIAQKARKRAEAERERLVQELQKALANVRTLSGLLPICANCKKIRDDNGSWNQIEIYIRERSDAQFTHGICPECAKTLYPTLYEPDKAPGTVDTV